MHLPGVVARIAPPIAVVCAIALPAAASCPAGIGASPSPLPAALVPAFQRAFGLDAPASVAQRWGVVRCESGTLLACSIGANLVCGPADPRRSIPAANAWCANNPGAAVVPAVVTGHATLYSWTCRGGAAVPAAQVAHADRAGYLRENWRALP